MGKIGDLWVKLKLKSDDYKKGLENAKQDTASFSEWVKKNWLKVTAGIAAATTAIKAFSKGVAIIADFEKANSVLAGVLGKTVAEIKALSDSAEMLGRSTAFTATQVTGLQTELAKLGFGEGQIMSMQKAVLNFATALGVDLSEAASFTGATLRTFGLKASDAEDALNVLAVASDKSALGFSALSTAMPIVGPVAKSLGFSLRDTSTLLGVLANSGFDASSAATALRNIFLYLADSSSNLSKAIGKPVKTLPDLLDGLDKLKSQGISVGEALELTDKRAVSAFNTLIDGTASARELRSALDDVNGAVDAKAQAQIDNISGSLSLLKSAWEGLILGMKNSKGVIKIVLDMLTRILEKAAGLFRGTRVQNYQKTYADAATNVYKGGGKEEAETYMQNQLKAKQDKVAELQALSQETVSPFESTPTAAARAAKRKLKDAQEQLEGMKAAYAAVADQIANDAVTDAVNTAGDGGTETADALLEAFKKALSNDKVQDAMSEFRAQVAEEAEVIAADEEFQKMADPLEEFEKSHAELLDRLNHKQQIFADMAQDAYAKAAKASYDYATEEQSALDLANEAAQTALDNLRASQEKAAEIGDLLSQTIAKALSDSTQAFTDMLFNIEGADASAVLRALLQPFANMAKQLGEILIAEGLGIKSSKLAFKTMNPYVAIAAGAALITLGATVSSGIKALGSSGGSSAMSSGSSATSNANSDTTISTEMTIYVKGKISGKDILISGDNAKKYYGR
jgi:TP901 family phage tail tape measure protein|nr:MAG TPA_asm: minor tail protein [Caudoviricetes sp.]